jgi:hypothetical protein
MTLDTKSDTSEPISAGGPSGAICQLFVTLGLSDLLGDIAGCGSKKAKSVSDQPGDRRARSLAGLLGVTK